MYVWLFLSSFFLSMSHFCYHLLLYANNMISLLLVLVSLRSLLSSLLVSIVLVNTHFASILTCECIYKYTWVSINAYVQQRCRVSKQYTGPQKIINGYSASQKWTHFGDQSGADYPNTTFFYKIVNLFVRSLTNSRCGLKISIHQQRLAISTWLIVHSVWSTKHWLSGIICNHIAGKLAKKGYTRYEDIKNHFIAMSQDSWVINM